jgi:hypothetical protein
VNAPTETVTGSGIDPIETGNGTDLTEIENVPTVASVSVNAPSVVNVPNAVTGGTGESAGREPNGTETVSGNENCVVRLDRLLPLLPPLLPLEEIHP